MYELRLNDTVSQVREPLFKVKSVAKVISSSPTLKSQLKALTRSILKKDKHIVTLGTFCYRDQSFINRRGVGYFFHGKRGTEPDPPPPPHTHTQSK